MSEKFILDACCGPRQMWFNKKHPNTVYIDVREEEKGFLPNRKNITIKPDMIMDFRNMTFEEGSFKLVVFDPPHLLDKEEPTNHPYLLKRKYGTLSPLTWKRDLKEGFDECWRVLEEFGILIFKWNASHISSNQILKVLGREPLFRNITGKNKRTFWACFMKLPDRYNQQETLRGAA